MERPRVGQLAADASCHRRSQLWRVRSSLLEAAIATVSLPPRHKERQMKIWFVAVATMMMIGCGVDQTKPTCGPDVQNDSQAQSASCEPVKAAVNRSAQTACGGNCSQSQACMQGTQTGNSYCCSGCNSWGSCDSCTRAN